MIFGIDRVQLIEGSTNYYLITEFIELSTLDNIIYKLNNDTLEWVDIYNLLNKIDLEKMTFILNNCFHANIILSGKDNDDKLLKIHYDEKWYIDEYTFSQLSDEFRATNNLSSGHSKTLGSAKEDNYDFFTNTILGNLYNISNYKDDCGLILTKNLLNSDPTKGFDLDLFQYIPSTKQHIFYEFLKRENPYVTNITAHPMKYCWTGSQHDNKKKFINLWRITQNFKGKLFLINYSDNLDEDISLIEVTGLDENLGFRSEIKYVMNYHEFMGWLNYMNTYNKTTKDYLDQFKSDVYDEDFFNDWEKNKSSYGK